jgi:hypothetical protein
VCLSVYEGRQSNLILLSAFTLAFGAFHLCTIPADILTPAFRISGGHKGGSLNKLLRCLRAFDYFFTDESNFAVHFPVNYTRKGLLLLTAVDLKNPLPISISLSPHTHSQQTRKSFNEISPAFPHSYDFHSLPLMPACLLHTKRLIP